jgi:hypothetical protein
MFLHIAFADGGPAMPRQQTAYQTRRIKDPSLRNARCLPASQNSEKEIPIKNPSEIISASCGTRTTEEELMVVWVSHVSAHIKVSGQLLPTLVSASMMKRESPALLISYGTHVQNPKTPLPATEQSTTRTHLR